MIILITSIAECPSRVGVCSRRGEYCVAFRLYNDSRVMTTAASVNLPQGRLYQAFIGQALLSGRYLQVDRVNE